MPITDGAGKPWVYRYKDLVGWWSNLHYNRIGGVEVPIPTAWTPRSKPIWFTELGCPAVDKGPNQPNVFPDPKSSESASPHFSSGGRSDIAQRRFLEAHQGYWDPSLPGFEATRNPLAPGGFRMLDHTRTLLWSWDARPFPAFPARGDVWLDGGNWHAGHWLNGRLDGVSCSDLIDQILSDYDLPQAETMLVEGTVQGYVIQDPSTARAALEPLTNLFGITVSDEGDHFVLGLQGAGASAASAVSDIALSDEVAIEISRTADHDLPREAVLGAASLFLDYQASTRRSRRLDVLGSRQHVIGFPGAMEPEQGQGLLDDWMRRVWAEREEVNFSVAPADIQLDTGAIIRLPDGVSDLLVTGVEEGWLRRVSARQIVRMAPTPWRAGERRFVAAATPGLAGRPDAHFLDLPMAVDNAGPETRYRIAAWQKPWRSQTVYASADTSGFSLRTTVSTPAVIGRLTSELEPGQFEGRADRLAAISVKLSSGEMSSVTRLQLLNGANAAAVQSATGAWEVLQFEHAEEIAPDNWQLTGLLRGQLGTNDAMTAGADAGAVFVLLDRAVVPAGLTAGETGLARNWRIGPAGYDISPENFVEATGSGGLRAQLPLSPVHLKVRREGMDLALSWIRRTRIGGDDWQQVDVQLGETLEQYQVEIAPAGGAVLRTATASEQHWTYTAAAIAADFGGMPDEFDLTVRQLSGAVGWGIPAKRRLAVG